MGWSNQSIFQVIIVPGGGGGLFVYSGAPAAGNEPVFSVVAPGVTSDPFGNAVSAVLNAGSIPSAYTRIDANGNLQFFKGSTIRAVFNPNLQAFLFYNPSLGLGNLAYSITNNSGTDSVGNAYLPGATAYKQITATDFQAFQANSGGWNLWTAAAAGGPWNLNFSTGLQPDEVGYSMASNVSGNSITVGETASALQVFGGAEIFTGNLAWDAGATGDKLTLTKTGGAPLLEVDNLANASTPSIRVTTLLNLVQQLAFAVRVATDANARLTLGLDPNGNGRLNAGSGAASPDVALFRGAPNLWASDYIAYNQGSAAEIWNAVTFQNSWANSTGAGMSYRLVAAPDNCIQFVGRIVVPAGFVAGQTVFSIGTAAYHPANAQSVTGVNIQTGGLVRFQYGTGGGFVYQSGGNAAGNTIDVASFPVPLSI